MNSIIRERFTKRMASFLIITAMVLMTGCGSTAGVSGKEGNTRDPAVSDSGNTEYAESAEMSGLSSSDPTDQNEQAQTASDKENNVSEGEDEMNIKITVGDHTIKATLYDNAAARQLYNSLPVTYPMMNLYGREMCYRMGAGSLRTDEASDTGYEIGDISYWPPAGSLVILYKQNGEVFEQQPIGHTDDDISFFDGMDDTDITWERDE